MPVENEALSSNPEYHSKKKKKERKRIAVMVA
jgi:hypothetical protein